MVYYSKGLWDRLSYADSSPKVPQTALFAGEDSPFSLPKKLFCWFRERKEQAFFEKDALKLCYAKKRV